MITRKTDPESKAFWRRVDEAADEVREFVERQRKYLRGTKSKKQSFSAKDNKALVSKRRAKIKDQRAALIKEQRSKSAMLIHSRIINDTHNVVYANVLKKKYIIEFIFRPVQNFILFGIEY